MSYSTGVLPHSVTSFMFTLSVSLSRPGDLSLKPRILDTREVENGFNFIYEEGPDGPRQSKIFQLTERVRLHHS